MDAVDLLNSDAAELPCTRDTDDFEEFLNRTFDTYQKQVAALDAPDYVSLQVSSYHGTILALCKRICKAVEHYHHGFPHLAFAEMDLAIGDIRPHFDRLCTPHSVAHTPTLSELYRIRVSGPDGAAFTRPDLFHIPFEKRHLVTRQRYSLPGLPCLYLGSTLYVSWEELGRPAFDTVYYARYSPTGKASITFLDFGYRPAHIAAMIATTLEGSAKQTDRGDFAVAQAVCWPILMTCSIRRKNGIAPFIHEYIVPQLILQWIAHSSKHDGIRYFSVNVTKYIDNPTIACNYVFPARAFAAAGHCSMLRSKFEMSEPLNWQLVERTGIPDGVTLRPPIRGKSSLCLIGDHRIEYMNTPFGMIESKSLIHPLATF